MTALTSYLQTLGCRRVAPLLFARSQNAPLSPTELARLDAHLAACVACQREAAGYAAIAARLRQSTPPLSRSREIAPLPVADLWSRIEAEITPSAQTRQQRQPLSRPAAHFVPRLGGLAWAGSLAIVFASGAWMTYGGGFWGHARHNAPAYAALADASPSPSVATLTILPPPPAPRMASGVSAKPFLPASTSFAANTVAPAKRGKTSAVRPAALAASFDARPDPFAPLADTRPARSYHTGASGAKGRTPAVSSFAVSLASSASPNRGRTPAVTPAGDGGRIAAAAVRPTATLAAPHSPASELPLGVAPASDVIADVAAARVPVAAAPDAVSESLGNPAPVATRANTMSAFAFGYNKPAPEVESHTASTPSDEVERPVPPTSGGAFSVADSAARMRRQRALFSYGRQ